MVLLVFAGAAAEFALDRAADERLDRTPLWPISGMTRDQRLYGGVFPAAFLDAPLVIEWSWALGGPRSAPR